jgi:hypothetical protein
MLRKATPERLSTFSDGVFAVLITVLVLDLRPPELPMFKAVLLLWPTWLSYAVSYLFIAIVWTNHHYLMRYATEATPRLLWFNFAHLFSMSLLPLSTAWMAASELAPQPVAFYAAVAALQADGEKVRGCGLKHQKEKRSMEPPPIGRIATFELGAPCSFYFRFGHAPSLISCEMRTNVAVDPSGKSLTPAAAILKGLYLVVFQTSASQHALVSAPRQSAPRPFRFDATRLRAIFVQGRDTLSDLCHP